MRYPVTDESGAENLINWIRVVCCHSGPSCKEACVVYTEEDPGVRKSEVVSWYLKEVEAEIETEAQLIERKTLAEKVIYRLVNHVSSFRTCLDPLPFGYCMDALCIHHNSGFCKQ